MVAPQFVDTQFEMGTSYNDVIAPQDVATYGGLCALASFDRAELKVGWTSRRERKKGGGGGRKGGGRRGKQIIKNQSMRNFRKLEGKA